MESRAAIESALAHCCGTECYRFNAFTKAAGMVYTDGVYIMAEMAEAWWLIDAIASYQPRCMKDKKNMLQYFQAWTLTVTDKTAILKCERDTDDVFLTQEIEYTDFPLDEIKVWLEPTVTRIDGVERQVMLAMLPSER